MTDQPGSDGVDAHSIDLRGFIAELKDKHPRECITVDDVLSGDWELAACTIGLEKKLRVPLIEYTGVRNTDFTVVHNVCSSLARIARVMGCTVGELETKLSQAYDALIEPEVSQGGPVRDVVHTGKAIDLMGLPLIRYTSTQSKPYISAASVVATDPSSGVLNISFNRLMVVDSQMLTIYMTPGTHLDRIFQANKLAGRDTPIAAFIGSHPVWSLGSLASGPLALSEYGVIGGLLGRALPVVRGLHDQSLLIPTHAEIAIEGIIKHDVEIEEGPYGEAFGYVSDVDLRPAIQVHSLSHRHDPIFQDIVPGRLEHMTMTSVAIKVHLQKKLTEQYAFVNGVHLPAPMTAHLSISRGTAGSEIRAMIQAILEQERFLKNVFVFDDDVALDNSKQTQRALAMHVQAERDLIVINDLPGNGLDPSEINGRTSKWGIDATATSVNEGDVITSQLPEEVASRLDIDAIWKRASQSAKK